MVNVAIFHRASSIILDKFCDCPTISVVTLSMGKMPGSQSQNLSQA